MTKKEIKRTAVRRRGTTIAAAALSVALVAPFVHPVVAPQNTAVASAAPGQITDSAGNYLPVDNGRVYDDGVKDGVRFVGLVPEYVDAQAEGAAFVFKVPHWTQSNGYKEDSDIPASDPDANAQYIRFRDKELYSQIARIELVGTQSDPQGTFTKRDPNGSEWTLSFPDSTPNFPGAPGTNYASYIQVFLNDGKKLSDLNAPESGFAADYYWVRHDGRIVRNSVQNAVMISPDEAVEMTGAPTEQYTQIGKNVLPLGVSKNLNYDQKDNTLKSTTTAYLNQNWEQGSVNWSWLFKEQLDPKIAPYVNEVTIYNSDVDGNKSKNRKTFTVGFDKATGLASTDSNPEISWAEDGADITAARYREVRQNVNDIMWGTLGQSRSWTIEYKLDPEFIELTNQPEGEYLEALSWVEVDRVDKFVPGAVNIVNSTPDNGEPPQLLKGSVATDYVNLIDTDGDGLTDQYEREIGSDSTQADTDGDGVPDGQEVLTDKTNPTLPGSYLPAKPTSAQDKVNINDPSIDVRALRTEYTDPKTDRLIPVSNNGVAPMTVWVLPTEKLNEDENGKVTFDQADAVGRNSMGDRREYENGALNIPKLSGLTAGENYTLVAISPNGETTKGTNFTVTDAPLDASAKPTIEPVTTSDSSITLKAPAGSDVAVTLPSGTVVVAKEDPNNPGTFVADVPRSSLPLQEGDKIKAVATEPGKEPSEEVEATVGETAAVENYGIDYPALVTAENETATAQPTFSLNGESVDSLPEGTEFKADQTNAPEGTKVAFDENGVATITVPKQEANAEAYNFELPVTASVDGKEVTDTIVVQVPAGEIVPAPPVTVKKVDGQEVWSGDPIEPIQVETEENLEDPTYELVDAPEGLSIDPKTGEITGTPAFDKAAADLVTENGDAVYNVTVKVTDGESSGTQVFPVLVKDSERDSDGDGLTDKEEAEKGTDPNNADSDGDGLTDKEELDGSKNNGEPTDPNKADSDGDGVNDKDEIDAGTDPNDPNSKPEETPENPSDDAVKLDESGKQAVKPTEDEQTTGIKVDNKTDETTVKVQDEDGKTIPSRIDDDGNVVVTPGTDVDGPITVTVDDPSLDKPLTSDVDVEGHEKGQDDNGDGKPAGESEGKTTVEGADNPKTVKPTDEKQDTGVKVTNPGEDTKVSATDEDGNEVPVEIDDNGNVVVTPGTKVDGPITVTVEDPDLDKPVKAVVPVEGHEKGRDDNNSDKKPKKPMIPGLPWGPSWPVPPTKPGDDNKGKDSDGDGLTDDQEKELGTDPNKADTDGDGIKDGAEVDGSENPFDKDGNKVKPGENGAPTDPTKPDSDGDGTNDGDEVSGSKNDGKPTDPNDADSKPAQPSEPGDEPGDKPGEPGEPGLSSELSERCVNTGLGIGIPLLFLIPVGLASQMNIPGLSDFIAPINKQIQDLNTRLQMQTNTFNGPLAKQMSGIDAQLKRFGVNANQAAGAVALISAGALAIGLLADACTPGADEEGSSSN